MAGEEGFSCAALELKGFDCAGCACELDDMDPEERAADREDRRDEWQGRKEEWKKDHGRGGDGGHGGDHDGRGGRGDKDWDGGGRGGEDGRGPESETLAAAAGTKSYVLFGRPRPWAEARDACRATGGSLAAVESAEEQAAVASLAQTTAALWLGGTDREVEGKWTWTNERKGARAELDFERWSTPDRAAATAGCGKYATTAEPNDAGSGEDCMGLYGSCGLWFDHPCDEAKAYVCQYAASEPAASSSKASASGDAAEGGGHVAIIVVGVLAACLLAAAACFFIFKNYQEDAGRVGYGQSARAYVPSPNTALPSYSEYVFNPAVELGGTTSI